ncbi:uncharacterized protein LOC112590275 isoform X1 [Harpegnathos saltator]|uniref:uncharacterized protein LOC112590275 isoform X1 n=1 Tax=Harpegnathos saltator TaxID=610380 RepID=UPI000DBECF40|nr:uncharacterized protein LOC112590275 isoform X1 [Harpegnathos saltator]
MHTIFALFVITSGFITEMSANYLRDRLPNLHTCPKSRLQACLPRSLDSMRPYLAQGVPQLSIPSFEPYYTQFYKMTFENQYIPMIKFRDTYINSISNFTISRVRVVEDHYIEFLARFPFVGVSTKFNAYVSYTSPTLIKSSRYRLNSNFTNVVAEIIIRGRHFEDEEQYFYVNNVTVAILKFEGMKTNKQQRGTPENVTQLANDYLALEWDPLTYEIIYNIKNIAAELIQTIWNRIYTNFPTVMLTSR